MFGETYFIDLGVANDVFYQNIYYLFKLLIVAIFFFYYLPTKLFPQHNQNFSVKKVVINFTYMTAYIELVVTTLIFFKIFSIILFIIVLIITKLLFLKFYYKKNVIEYLDNKRVDIMLFSLDLLDKPKLFRKRLSEKLKLKIIKFQNQITFYNVLKFFLVTSLFFYIMIVLMARGLESVADPVPDTAQFIEWVADLEHNILYSDTKEFGADMYGLSILLFFIHSFTNIDTTIIFSIYPILLLFALYFSIYYVLKDWSNSEYVAIFGVMLHGVYLMSPLAHYLLGTMVFTNHPEIVNFWKFSFYAPPQNVDFIKFGHKPYIRYISGMAYEHSSIFSFLNGYFLIKTLWTKQNKYLILYCLTLMLVFTFHGGGAIPLLFISIFIAINSIIFRKLDKNILKKGLLAILVATILGNLWMFSVIKYGIPRDFGAAAPFLDKLFNTKENIANVVGSGLNSIALIAVNNFHYLLFIMFIIAILISIFSKRKFLNLSFLSIIGGIFLVYFGPDAGFPIVTLYTRLAEYLFFAITLLFSFFFYYLFYIPLLSVFKEKAKYLILSTFYIIFLFSILATPKWVNSPFFWQNINHIEFSSIPAFIFKIHKNYRHFSWTLVSYVQEYPKVKDKGYHINTQEFLLRYSPIDKYLDIPTEIVFIVVENFYHPYQGLNEWFYRWRYPIQNNLKSWITTYRINHNNIKIAFKSDTITIYKIDNREYIKSLKEKGKK